MALKHLRDAVELMRGGMSIADITKIVGLPDEDPETITEPETSSTGPEQDKPLPDDPGEQDKPLAPAEDPPEPPKPTNRPEHNNEPSTLVDELNKIF